MNNDQKFYNQVEKDLGVKFDKVNGSSFEYEGMELYYIPAYTSSYSSHGHRIGSRSRGKGFKTLEDEDLDVLLLKLKKNKDKYKAKYNKCEEQQQENNNNTVEIHNLVQNTKVKAELRFDGQNLTVRTGKDPRLVEYILSCLESYENDPMIKLVYK